MYNFVDALDEENEASLNELEKKLSNFYNNFAHSQNYWIQANAKNETWDKDTTPFHYHLKTLIKPNSKVVDFGCGSAHPYQKLKEIGINYTGLEWSQKQVEENKKQYPEANFIACDITEDQGLSHTADWVVSFFVLEHLVRPHLLLKRMVETLKPGGHLGLICPHFLTYMNSLRSGFRATTKTDKLKKMQLLDLVYSYLEERFFWPMRVKKIRESAMQFPVYLKPACLEAPYFSDNDAVYLTNQSKIEAFLRESGMKILFNARNISNHDQIVYIIAKKEK